MVAPAVTHRETLSADLTRAIRRAADEQLVIFRLCASTLGVATIAAGELTCSCKAGATGRICKHISAGIFAHKHGVYAVKPIPAPKPESPALAAARAQIRAEITAGLNPLCRVFE